MQFEVVSVHVRDFIVCVRMYTFAFAHVIENRSSTNRDSVAMLRGSSHVVRNLFSFGTDGVHTKDHQKSCVFFACTPAAEKS